MADPLSMVSYKLTRAHLHEDIFGFHVSNLVINNRKYLVGNPFEVGSYSVTLGSNSGFLEWFWSLSSASTPFMRSSSFVRFQIQLAQQESVHFRLVSF